MQEIMSNLRKNIDKIGGRKIVKCMDFSSGLNGLPKSNVLKFILENDCSIVIRPSGTEPKLKIYLSLSGENKEEVVFLNKMIIDDLKKRFFTKE